MSSLRKTRSPVYVRLSERRIRQIEELVEGWSPESRRFVQRRLSQYEPKRSMLAGLWSMLRELAGPVDHSFQILKDPQLLSDWHKRFEVAGSQDATAAWDKILDRELTWHDYQYLFWLIKKKNADSFVPPAFAEIFHKLYHAYILKEYTEDPKVPRAPLVLVVGGSGSGKSATVKQALEETMFLSEVRPVIDLMEKKEEVLADQPFWRSLEEVDLELAVRIDRRRRRENLRYISRIPVIRYLFRERISKALSSLEEEGVWVDFAMITPNDYQTAWAGEPGNYLRKAMGDPKRTCIRHLEEAHSAFGRPDKMSSVQGQQATLVDAANIIIDEIVFGRRDCLLIATTDQPEQIDPAIYRRFVEKGVVIDVNEYWEDSKNLKEVVRLELKRMRLSAPEEAEEEQALEAELEDIVEKLYPIFKERSLRITPAYVRRLLGSVFSMKGDFNSEYLDEQLIVRDALKAVARNVYGSLYKSLVGQMDRRVHWEDYIGAVKNEFSEMINNSLFYNVSEEKGVVLTGPPGSGKTYMVQAWLGDNEEVQDLAVNLNDLADPTNPLEGMVENLERVFDIAKMLSPSMVFFDEGDSVAPRRSAQGGSPYDKVTNKFLSIIDGESPLNRVFTVLTTNRLDIIDPALIRSKRLKVLNVPGSMRDEDVVRIMAKELKGIELEEGLSYEEMVKVAHGLCETPADFTAFAQAVRSLRSTEVEVLGKLLPAVEGSEEERTRFVRFNYKILIGLLEGTCGGSDVAKKARAGEEQLLECLDEAAQCLVGVNEAGRYPISRWHLNQAKTQLAKSPTRKDKQQLDEFLETELSREPQVGFVVGVGATDTTGVLLPIASSLVYNVLPQKIIVTGAVSTSAPGAAEMDLAVQMTHQSAQEAFTLAQNYLQSLCEDVDVSRTLGRYLDGYSIHHQLLSASYSVGGPSAGFALAINTLSSLLHIPVLNDFGITGAPWTRGAQKGDVGASVIIGGHRKKAEKVLQYLPRMYMPQQNYQDLEPELLRSCRIAGRDIRGVKSFSALVPEVYYFNDEINALLEDFLQKRRETDLGEENSSSDSSGMDELSQIQMRLRSEVEAEIRRRMEVIRKSLLKPSADTNIATLFSRISDEADSGSLRCSP